MDYKRNIKQRKSSWYVIGDGGNVYKKCKSKVAAERKVDEINAEIAKQSMRDKCDEKS